jgi:hypothetical protein
MSYLMPIEDTNKAKKIIRVELADRTETGISFKLYFTSNLKKYFNTDEFTVKYNRPIDNVGDGILHVPVVSSLAPVAWAAGADLHVRALDGTFRESLRTIKGVMRRMYRGFSFAGDIRVDRVDTSRFGHKGTAQLFTAGVDSTATFIRHREEKPHLIAFNAYSPHDGRLQRLLLDEIYRFAGRNDVGVSTTLGLCIAAPARLRQKEKRRANHFISQFQIDTERAIARGQSAHGESARRRCFQGRNAH